ncbi:COG1361 family protein [Novipirellula artificiosorum]|uniref:Large cysteine-rich periplasmic protein OmcB n=1 Tax=Novipirellula artificiosorum TaxID=2528016 RepID=A0A5C6E0I3_9BACT|nr:DUF11 domain-containing protein [Novipirellula artificiosorum]TWU42014.1 Large cysteine-rich periplasmic protein OmcB [Novipirellula artificiosorum]
MMRRNRKMLLASTLVAIPFALLMSTLSTGQVSSDPRATGTTSTVQHAVGQQPVNSSRGDEATIQQVVGKQFDSRSTRSSGTLMQAFGFGEPKQTEPRAASQPQPHQHDNSGGLFGVLFNRSKKSESSTSSNSNEIRFGSSASSSSQSGSVDWSGIPYHSAHNSSTTQPRTPIQDPGSASRQTRIIRGRVPQPLSLDEVASNGASTSTSRIPTPPSIARSDSPVAVPRSTGSSSPLTVPVPTVAQRQSRPSLSSETSSRRSGRRSLEALDLSEVASTKSPTSTRRVAESAAPTELVPKVARRVISTPVDAETVAEATQKKLVLEPKPAPEQVASAASPETAKASISATAPADRAAPKTAALATPTTTSTLSGSGSTSVASNRRGAGAGSSADSVASKPSVPVTPVPTPTPTPTPSAELAHSSTPKSGLSSSPNYQTPDMKSQPIEMPALPNAANTLTPSQTVSHRAGPPPAAFGPGEFVPANRPNIVDSQSSLPVGSGLAASKVSADAATQPYTQQYVAQPVATPVPALNTPSGIGSNRGKMATFGQPVSPQTVPAKPAAHPMTRSVDGTVAADVELHDTRGLATDNFQQPNLSNDMRNGAGGRELMPGHNAVASELPGIRVVTHGPGEIMIRQNRQYEIRVENRGSIDANGLLVRALIPDWAEVQGHNASQGAIENQAQDAGERLVWRIDSLPAGSVERMFVQLRAQRSGTYDLDVDWTLVPQHSIATVKVHEPRLDLTIDGPEEVVYGQSQAYTVRVLNPGDGTAPNVVFTLSPNSATPQTQRIGDIPAGKEAQFEVELTAQDLVDLKIHGLASGDLELRAEAEKTIRVSAAKLEAILTGPELRYQNTESLYNLQVQNTGSATSENIAATLRLPKGVKYLGGIDEATAEAGSLNWTIKALAPEASRNYQFRCNMNATGDQKFVFECEGTAAGRTGVALATRVDSIADLVLTINDPPAPAPIGTDVTYEIVVRNRGSKEANEVRAIAQFSHGIEPNRIEGQSGELLTGQVLFDPIPAIAAGQEVRLRVVAKADRAGHHRFRTEIRSGDTVLVAEEATHYMSPQSDRVSRHSSDVEAR